MGPTTEPRGAAKDIDSYLAAVPEPARTTLEKMLKSIRAAAPNAQESISYQIPAFKLAGRPLLYMAAFKNHCSVYPIGDVVWADLGAELTAAGAKKTGPGTVRIPIDKPLSSALLTKLVKLRIQENENP